MKGIYAMHTYNAECVWVDTDFWEKLSFEHTYISCTHLKAFLCMLFPVYHLFYVDLVYNFYFVHYFIKVCLLSSLAVIHVTNTHC